MWPSFVRSYCKKDCVSFIISTYCLFICSSLVSNSLYNSEKKYLSLWNSSSLNFSISFSFISLSLNTEVYSLSLLYTVRVKVFSYCFTSKEAPSSAKTKSCLAWCTTHSGQRPTLSSRQKYFIRSAGCSSHIIFKIE